MSRATSTDHLLQILHRTQEIHATLAALDVLAFGTLHRRTKTCGRPNCRCHKDEAARHGPYFEWTRLKAGKLVHTTVNQEQVDVLERAIANQRLVKELLSRWHEETEALILDLKKSTQS
jgi:hypothetical protein